MAIVQPPAFGSLLRQYRLAAGLTQEELAERARLSARAISDLERGVRRTPYRDTVQQLASALVLGPEDRAAFEAAARRTGDVSLATATVALLGPTGAFLGSVPVGRLVGREDELARILSVVDAVEAGSGRVVLVVGEPGTGKTRLAQEVTIELRERGFLVATGRCYQPQQAVPFYPFLDALAVVYAVAPPEVRAAVPDRWPQLARLLPDQGFPLPVAIFSEQEEQEWLFRAVTGFLAAVAERIPVALLLDDLHWADHASLELLQHLARHMRGNRVFILGTYRDVGVVRERPPRPQYPLRQALRRLDREGLIERVPVDPLPQAGTAALMAAILGTETVSPELAAFVHRHTEGNAFFTQELVRALVERGDVCRQDGRWICDHLGEIEVPESVRDAIEAHLSGLSGETQEVLYQASVLGHAFQFDDLRGMSDRSEEDLEQALEEARAAGFVRATHGDRYVFNHGLTQQTLYTELAPRRRRRLHLAAGKALERLPEPTREARAPELVWHLIEGEDRERALPYALMAGDRAEAVFAHWEAEQQYRTALELARAAGDRVREAEALEKLGDVLQRRARQEKARASYEKALPLVPEGDRVWRSSLHRKIARTWAAGSAEDRPEDALRALDCAERALGEEPPEGDVARRRAWMDIQLDRMEVYETIGRAREIGDLLERTRPLVEELGTLRQWASFFRNLSNAALRRDRFAVSEEALEYARHYLSATLELGGAGEVALAQFHVGFCYLWHGDLEEAEELLQTALRTAEHAKDVRTQAQCLIYLTMVCRRQGRVETVREYVGRSQAAAKAADLPGYLAMAEAHLAWASWREGDVPAARAKATAALDGWQRLQVGYAAFYWMAVWPLLGVALAESKTAEAIEHARTLIGPTMQPFPESLTAELAESIAHWEARRRKAARERLQRASLLATGLGYL